jgi:Protein of unknown function (DUF2975)
MGDSDTDPVRRSAVTLRRLLTATTIVLLTILVLERLGYAGAYRRGGFDAAQLPAQLLLSLPALMNLAALWCLRGAVAAAAGGEPFGRMAAAAFRRVGALLAASAVTALLIVPALARPLGLAPQRLIDADISTLVLGAIGLGMLFVGKLIARAGAAERELEAFF